MSKERDYPSCQPFNVAPHRNLTKKNSWWSKPPFHNNSQQKVKNATV